MLIKYVRKFPLVIHSYMQLKKVSCLSFSFKSVFPTPQPFACVHLNAFSIINNVLLVL